MAKQEKEFDPNATMIQRVTGSRTFKPAMVLTAIATLGGAIVGVQAITGVNLRPAFGHEIEGIHAKFVTVAEVDATVQKRLDTLLEIQNATSKSLIQLKGGQLDLKMSQLERRAREVRRTLAEHQTRAQEQYRDQGQPVPGWLRDSIVDAEAELDEIRRETDHVETQQLELEQQ